VRRFTKSAIFSDVGSLALGSGALGLVFLQEPFGVLAQALGLGQFVGDALAAGIELVEHFPGNAVIEQNAPENDEGDRDPEFSAL
jgi:hypothetical protein